MNMDYKHILIATDTLAQGREKTVAFAAKRIATKVAAKLSHLHTLEQQKHGGMGHALAVLCDFEEQSYHRAYHDMGILEHDIGLLAQDCSIEVGRFSQLTNQHAADIEADLIVTAEHNPDFFIFHRGEDKAILRSSPCDILFVKQTDKEYKNILVTVDLEQDDYQHIVERASQFARGIGATLNVIYIINEYPFSKIEYMQVSELMYNEKEFVQKAWQQLESLGEDFSISEDNQKLRMGDFNKVLREEIETGDIDLLVVGNREHHGVGKLAASTVAKILPRVSCDVLAVHLEETKKQDFMSTASKDEDLKRFYYH
jgi:nucleotide-binding universal stress UspA family protein